MLRCDQLLPAQHLRRQRLRGAGGGQQHRAFGGERGIAHLDFQQKPIQLRFRQRIGAFLFDGVLCGQHMEWTRQDMLHAGHRHAALLHRLEQGRLRARRGAVDLVGHQQLAEHRAVQEPERAPTVRAFFQHLAAQDIARHQVGGELDALARQPQHHRHRLHQPRLAQARHAHQQRMTAGEQGDQGEFDGVFLAVNRAPDLRAHHLQPPTERHDIGQQRVGVGRGRLGEGHT